ncbi:MAG: hypothetical protein CK424_01480 [Legionella sp.]|nr:MAG: hypothetical protein CK424_01480 [Legionella sp.]
MPILLHELSNESKNKLTTSPFDFKENEDIDQSCMGGNAFYFYTDITPLMYAAYSGDLALTKELVECGADLNKIDNQFNRSALMWASRYGRDKVTEYLLIKKADASYIAKARWKEDKDENAYSLSKKDSCCSIFGFWQRAEEVLGKADYDRTRTLLELDQNIMHHR